MSLALLLLPLLLSGATAAPGPLESYFVGTTEGSGNVDVILSGSHGMRDRAHGRIDASGALILDQVVEEQGKPARRRTWRLARSGEKRLTGTISDARGPVAGEIAGNSLHLRYRLNEGPSVEQRITLAPGGRRATNRMTFRRFGFKVATVESQIHKLD